ncbi:hypothetical protein [Kitasatospora sp. NPDC001132]
MVTVPEQLPNVLDRAVRVATTRRTVTALVIPADVQELDQADTGRRTVHLAEALALDDPVPADRPEKAVARPQTHPAAGRLLTATIAGALTAVAARAC